MQYFRSHSSAVRGLSEIVLAFGFSICARRVWAGLPTPIEDRGCSRNARTVRLAAHRDLDEQLHQLRHILSGSASISRSVSVFFRRPPGFACCSWFERHCSSLPSTILRSNCVRVEDISRQGKGFECSLGLSDLPARPIEGEHPYVYLDGIVLKGSRAGEVRNASLLVAIAVTARLPGDSRHLRGSEGGQSGLERILKHFKGRGLRGTADAFVQQRRLSRDGNADTTSPTK